MSLVVVGLLFKASVGPFHLWTPDVYQGAPTPVTAFMAVLHQGRRVRRHAAVVCQRRWQPMAWTWQPVLGVIAGASMVIGAVIGITQTDMKRMLAYSSVAHAGFILLGVLAMSAERRVGDDVLPAHLRHGHDRRASRSSRWSARATARPRSLATGPAWPSGRRCSPRR